MLASTPSPWRVICRHEYDPTVRRHIRLARSQRGRERRRDEQRPVMIWPNFGRLMIVCILGMVSIVLALLISH